MGAVKFYKNNKVDKEYLARRVQAPFETDHGNVAIIAAPGDFTLMHRNAWQHIRGHPEVPLVGMLDDFVVWQAVAMGLHAVSSLDFVARNWGH